MPVNTAKARPDEALTADRPVGAVALETVAPQPADDDVAVVAVAGEQQVGPCVAAEDVPPDAALDDVGAGAPVEAIALGDVGETRPRVPDAAPHTAFPAPPYAREAPSPPQTSPSLARRRSGRPAAAVDDVLPPSRARRSPGPA